MSTDRIATLKYNVHTCFQDMPRERATEISSKLSLPIHLMLFNFDGNMNIAMSIRSAAVLGCSDVWIVGKRKYDARPEVGAKYYIRVHKIPDLEDPEEFFKTKDIQPFLIEQGGIPLESMNFKPYQKKPVCFIMGSEGRGIPDAFAAKLPKAPRLTISQYGMIRSLNVSIAGSIVMYEYLKQMRHASPYAM